MNELSLIGIDIGGSFIKGGVVSQKGEVRYKISPHLTSDGPMAVKTVRSMIDEALFEIKPTNIPPVQAIGISTSGVIDPVKGIILQKVSIPNYPGTNWIEELHDSGLPVIVENDARSAAWAEFQNRENRNIQDWIHLTLGTKIGSGIILNGKLWRGHTFNAGEIGHISVSADGPACTCGNIGCLELFVSKNNLLQTVLEGLQKGGSDYFRPGTTEKCINLHDISAAEQNGDALANAAFQKIGQYLGIGLTTLVNLLNPPVITIGGGTIEASTTILKTARDYVSQHAILSARKNLRIEKGKLGNQAGFVGAALLALDREN